MKKAKFKSGDVVTIDSTDTKYVVINKTYDYLVHKNFVKLTKLYDPGYWVIIRIDLLTRVELSDFEKVMSGLYGS